MNMRTSIATLTFACVILMGGSVAGAAPTQVNVRIEGRTETLFEGPILTEGHDVRSFKADGGDAAEDIAEHPCDGINPLDPENVNPGPTATAASVDAMNLIGETDALAGQWYPGYEDYFVKQWGSEEENGEKDGKAWGILVNNVFTDVGGCQYQLSKGDEVLWVYNAFESRSFLSLLPVEADYTSGDRPLTAVAQLNEPFEVEVLEYDDDKEDRPPSTPERTGAGPLEGAYVSPVRTSEKGFETVETASPATVTTGKGGRASITFTEPGWHRIMAGTPLNEEGEEEAIRSNRLDVCVPAVDQTSCAEPPAEDQVRTLPQYLEPVKEAHHEETGTGDGNPGGEQPGTGGGSAGGPQDGTGVSVTPTAPSTQTPAHSASDPAAQLTIASITPTRLLLKLTAAATATVKIIREVGERRDPRWQVVKTLTVRARKAGQVKVELGRLAAGHYRLSISLDGGKSTVRTLTVYRR
jgi:hypothetical protein